jgi:hypothetical protein
MPHSFFFGVETIIRRILKKYALFTHRAEIRVGGEIHSGCFDAEQSAEFSRPFVVEQMEKGRMYLQGSLIKKPHCWLFLF